MKTTRALLFALLAQLATARAGAVDEIQEMISRVESGLRHPIQVGTTPPLALTERMRALGVPGVSVALVENFELRWAKGYGVRDARGADPVTTETLFQAASISKSVTAVIALRLVQEKRLSLDDDVNGYLTRWRVPENPFTRNEKVTLRRLLSHTAGLPASGFRGYGEGESLPTLLQVLDGLPPAGNPAIRVVRTPGSGFLYSGAGTTIIQLLLEDASGRSLADLAAEYLFRPTGMTHSFFCLAAAGPQAAEAACGHSGNSSFRGRAFLPGGAGCCELWSTPSDLARFVVALQRARRGDPGAILSRKLARAMTTSAANGTAGLGAFVLRAGKTDYFYHDGGNTGFTSRFIGHPEKGSGFAVMINSENAFTLVAELTLAMAGAYGWEGIKPLVFKDAAAVVAACRLNRKRAPDDPVNSEESLNRHGYDLLACGYTEAAIGVFELNAEYNPRSANCRDSLAEARERGGDRAGALASYRKALELLTRFPEHNRNYGRAHGAVEAKIRRLESGR